MNKIYELKNVNKIYNNVFETTEALKDINLSINKGDIVVILGPSGSGKSTILNILSGIDNPTSGSILFNNTDIGKFNEKQLAEYRQYNLGFIFQSYNIIPNLTVRENIELGVHLGTESLDIDEIMNIVGLEDQKNKYPYQLSGGQLQRISVARAIVKNPCVLFCDEPTGALDEKSGKIVLKLLQEINQKYHTTIIIVTHNPSIAEMSNTIIKMNSGKITSLVHNKDIKSADELGWA